MNKSSGLIVGTIVIFLSFVFVCGTFLYLYLRDPEVGRCPPESSVRRERLSAIAVFVKYPLSSNTRWIGLLIKKTLQYLCSMITIPWGTTKF